VVLLERDHGFGGVCVGVGGRDFLRSKSEKTSGFLSSPRWEGSILQPFFRNN